MAIKDPATIMQELASIYRRAGVPDMVPGTFEWDLFVYGPTYGAIYPLWTYLQDFEAFIRGDYNAIPPDKLRAILESFGITGSEGSYARGYVTFYTETQPVDPISIPEGTVVAVEYDSSIAFATTSGLYIEPNYVDAYYDDESSSYRFRLPVRALSVGSKFNVPPGVVTVLVNSIPHIDGVINDSAITGGTDPITVEASYDKLADIFMSRHPLSSHALEEVLHSQFPEAGTIVIVRPGDPENILNLYGSTTEIYIARGLSALTSEEIFVTSETEIELSASPVLSLVSVSNESGTIPECTDGMTDLCYEFRTNTDPIAIGTLNEKGYITFRNVSGAFYARVDYTYDSLVRRMQLYLDGIDVLPDVKFVVRKAPAAEITVSIKVKLYPGADIAEVTSDVFNKISSYLDELDIGGVASVSDIVGYIMNHEMVDDVFLGTVQIDVIGPATYSGDYVYADRNAVLTLANLNLYE